MNISITTGGRRSGSNDYIDCLRYAYGIWPRQFNTNLLDTLNLTIERVIFNNPATIVIWSDGTKTIVKCSEDDVFDPEKGLAMAICKKVLGNQFKKTFKEWTPEEKIEDISEKVDFGINKAVENLRNLANKLNTKD